MAHVGIVAYWFDGDGVCTRFEVNPNSSIDAVAAGARVFIEAEHKAAALGCHPLSNLSADVLACVDAWRLRLVGDQVEIDPLAEAPPAPPTPATIPDVTLLIELANLAKVGLKADLQAAALAVTDAAGVTDGGVLKTGS